MTENRSFTTNYYVSLLDALKAHLDYFRAGDPLARLEVRATKGAIARMKKEAKNLLPSEPNQIWGSPLVQIRGRGEDVWISRRVHP